MFERRKHIVTLTVHASVSGAGTGVDTRLEKTSWNCFNFKQPILKKLFFTRPQHSSFTVSVTRRKDDGAHQNKITPI